jgi:arylsulfatase A-like enzyme
MDILPTICKATGADVPPRVDGSDILDTIVSGAPSPHKALYWSQGGQLATRRGPWKLVVNGRLYDRRPDGDKPLEGEDAVWLSNLDEDPGETRNLRRQHANLVDELLTELERWREALRKPE